MLNRDLLYKTAENMGVKIDDDAFKRFDIYAELLFETNKINYDGDNRAGRYDGKAFCRLPFRI